MSAGRGTARRHPTRSPAMTLNATTGTPKTAKTVLISGASIAGPALALWLHRYGFVPTVVERAPELRTGGYKVDIRGTAIEVCRRMGVLDEIRAHSTDMRGGSYVDDAGRTIGELPADIFGGRVEGTTRSCAANSPASCTTGPARTSSTSSATRSPRWRRTPTASPSPSRAAPSAASTWSSAPTDSTRTPGSSPSAPRSGSSATSARTSPSSPPPTTSAWTAGRPTTRSPGS